MRPILGLGVGGHARVLIDIIRLSGEYRIAALVDPARAGEIVAGVEIQGSEENLSALLEQGIEYAFIGVGGAGDNRPRRAVFDRLRNGGFRVASLIHPRAVVAADVAISNGLSIMANAVVNPGARLGDDVIVNTSSVVEHDCIIGSHCHIATGAHLAGGVTVGEGAHIGAGAVIRQGISVGAWSIVGAGAVVVCSVEPQTTVVGVPARPIGAAQPRG